MAWFPPDLISSASGQTSFGSSPSLDTDFSLAQAGQSDASSIRADLKAVGSRVGALGNRSDGWMLAKGAGQEFSIGNQIRELEWNIFQNSNLSPQALETIRKKVDELEQLVEKNPTPSREIVDRASTLLNDMAALVGDGASTGPLVPPSASINPVGSTPTSGSTSSSGGITPTVQPAPTGGEAVVQDFKSFGDSRFRRGGESNFESFDAYDAFTRRYKGVENAIKAEIASGDLSVEDQQFLKQALSEMREAWTSTPNDEKLFGILGRMEDRLNIVPPTGPTVTG